MSAIMAYITTHIVPNEIIAWQKSKCFKLFIFLILSSAIQLSLPVQIRLFLAFISLFFILFLIFKLNVNQSFWTTLAILLIIMVSDSITTFVIIAKLMATWPIEENLTLYYLIHFLSTMTFTVLFSGLFKKRLHQFLNNKQLLKKHQITMPLVFILILVLVTFFITLFLETENRGPIENYFALAFIMGLILLGVFITYFASKYLIRENEFKALALKLNQMESSMHLKNVNRVFEKSIEYDLMQSDQYEKIMHAVNIESLLYKGKNSQVYLLSSKDTTEKYTLKAIEKIEDIDYRFDELSTIKHGKIVGINAHFEGPFYHYVMKKFIDGQTLLEFVSKKGTLKEKETIHIALQIISALKYLHLRDEPIVFRDLKPSNIIVTPQKDVYLIDLESVRKKKNASDSDTFVVGTKGYASPEQYGYSQSTPKSDIYAFGATLYFCLMGETPDLFKIQNLESQWSHSTVLQKIIQKCLKFNPDERFHSVMEIEAILNDFVT